MTAFEPQDPNFEARIRESFSKQRVMDTFGAALTKVAPGEVEIELTFRPDLTQQHGFLHAGVVTTIVDSACGYAAYTLMPADSEVLTIEYKVNLLSPARGERMIARGRVTKPGRTVTVCAGDVFAIVDGEEKLIATMLATMISLRGRSDLTG
ncbi:MAG: PaaI family thioesterase [Blastocatellia bacterium]|nr:PaaI family thioesterase [Blastocatellia bacterium]